MKFCILIFIMTVLLFSAHNYSHEDFKETNYCNIAECIIRQHIREMVSEGFTATMTGGGFNKDVKYIAVGFSLSKKMLSIDEARSLFVRGAERLLVRINGDESIRPYLHNYPFDANNLEYEIDFLWLPVDASGLAPIVYVSVVNGKIFYRVYNPAHENLNPLDTVFDEPYEEALRIVRKAGCLDPSPPGPSQH